MRELLVDARARLGAYYRAEFVRLLDETQRAGAALRTPVGEERFAEVLSKPWSDEALRSAFVRFLKSNLRAIPIFGTAFASAIVQNVPAERAVAFGEESKNPYARAVIFAGTAFALIIAGAAGERYISNARATAQSSPPSPLVAQPVAGYATMQPAPERSAPAAKHVASIPAATPRAARPLSIPRVFGRQIQPQPLEPRLEFRPRQYAQATASPTPAAGRSTVTVTPLPQTPAPAATAIDVEDMPRTYSDSTPLPEQSYAPAEANDRGISVPTPKPTPKPVRGVINHIIKHLIPR